MPPTATTADLRRLLHFNHQVLAQAQALVVAHEGASAPAYDGPVGAHLRHVIEHHEALLLAPQPDRIDYDRRPRDRQLERRPDLASRRLLALQARLAAVGAAGDTPLRVRGQAGIAGDFEFDVASTFGRELVFVASHALHHFALLQPYCRQHGIAVDATFGKAPATVAFERHAEGIPSPTAVRAAPSVQA